jgi:hypothetical protein
MYLNRRPNQFSARGMAALATALFVGALMAPRAVQAQDPPFPMPLPQCYFQPDPSTDSWPRAVTDSLGSTAGIPVTFAGATLLANDTAGVTVRSVGSTSSRGGTIAGTDPYTFTPSGTGADDFPYEIIDGAGRTTMGIVRISVTGDVILPTVSISSPTGGTVSGSVLVRALASDNAGVTGVTFFDGAFPIATVAAAPFETPWATTLVANGSHTLTAVARDAANNSATSDPVVVNVNNVVMVTVPGVVGSSQAAATAAITAAGLTVGSVTGANSAAPVNSIISQSLVAGTQVASGTAMSLVYSLGPANVLVPAVVNLTQAAATTAITGASLTVGTVTTASSATVASGSVISQAPAAGMSVAPGSAVALVVSTGAPAPPAGGLVLALGFEEASGNPVVDSSAAPMNGTISGATRVAAGKIGRALSFDGVNDWVTVTDTAASKLDLTTGMTLEAWVNPTAAAGWETIVMKERGGAGEGLLAYALYARDGAPRAGGTAGPAGYLRPNPVASTTDRGVRGATAVPMNAWTHLATTYDGTNMRFYVNGNLVGTTAGSGSINVANGALRIGGNNSAPLGQGEFFKGLIDEVRVYNRALSAAEITTDMTTPVVP